MKKPSEEELTRELLSRQTRYQFTEAQNHTGALADKLHLMGQSEMSEEVEDVLASLQELRRQFDLMFPQH